jgi:hypothetical protein
VGFAFVVITDSPKSPKSVILKKSSPTNSTFLNSYLKPFLHLTDLATSRDSSVGIALGYGLDDRGSRVRLPAGAGNFSLYHRVQNGSGAHPASYPVGTRGSFPGGEAAGA